MVCTYNNVHMSRVSHNMPLVSLTSITSKCQGSIIGVESLCAAGFRRRRSSSSSGQNKVLVTTKQIHQHKKCVRLFLGDALRLFRGLSAVRYFSHRLDDGEGAVMWRSRLPLPNVRTEHNTTNYCAFSSSLLYQRQHWHIDPIIVIDKYHLRLVHFLCTNYIPAITSCISSSRAVADVLDVSDSTITIKSARNHKPINLKGFLILISESRTH